MQLQLPQLAERNHNHPQVHGDADRGMRPPKGVDIDAVARGLGVRVAVPEKRNRHALHNTRDNKRHARRNIKDDRRPEQPACPLAWKDGQVKDGQRQLDKGNLGEVQHLHGVEKGAKVVNLGRGEGPDVAAHAVRGEAQDVDDGGRDADDHGGEDGVVVPAEGAAVAVVALEDEAHDDEEVGDDAEDDGHDVVPGRLVADGSVAGEGCEVSGLWGVVSEG